MAGPAVGIVLLLGLLAALCIPLGLLILFLGLRGRRAGVSPTCARCNFDLGGIDTGPGSKCPECGTVLRDNIASGKRRRRFSLIILGGMLLVLGVTTVLGTLIGGGWVRLNPAKPAFLLRAEVALDGGLRDSAIGELNTRLSTGELSRSTTDDLVAQGLELQADESRAWISGFGDIIETAHARGVITDAAWRQYTLVAIKPRFEVTTLVTQGDVIAVNVKLGPSRVSQAFQLQAVGQMEELLLDGKPVKYIGGRPTAVSSAITSSGSASQTSKVDSTDLTPGSHQFTARLSCKLATDSAVSRLDTVDAPVKILPSGTPAHKLVTDPALRGRVAQGIEINHLSLTQGAGGRAEFGFTVLFTDFPVDAAFDLILKYRDEKDAPRELVLGSVCMRAMPGGKGQHGSSGGGDVAVDEATLRRVASSGKVDVEFRPSLVAAKAQTNLYGIWGEPVSVQTTATVKFLTPDK